MLCQHIVRSNEECLLDLITNHKQSTERRRVTKTFISIKFQPYHYGYQ